tara:strand:+ start:171 stop:344 length:174 start_codon:yes stop_codon:yes gene_type:complete
MQKIKKSLTLKKGADHRYRVIKAVNILKPEIMSKLKDSEVQVLIDSGVEVIIQGGKI